MSAGCAEYVRICLPLTPATGIPASSTNPKRSRLSDTLSQRACLALLQQLHVTVQACLLQVEKHCLSSHPLMPAQLTVPELQRVVFQKQYVLCRMTSSQCCGKHWEEPGMCLWPLWAYCLPLCAKQTLRLRQLLCSGCWTSEHMATAYCL